MIDAIDQLVSLFDSQEAFVKAFLEATLFLPPDAVEARNEEMVVLYRSGRKFPIRYSPAHRRIWKVRNKDEAVRFTRQHDARLPRYPAFNVRVDKDGNYENRRQIKHKLNQLVSAGKKSSVRNYTISHVWGLANHPLFFSALWNIVLIPTHFNYLMDKDPETHDVVAAVREAIERTNLLLYRPYEALLPHIPEIEEFEELLDSDATATQEADFRIHFLTDGGITQGRQAVATTYEERALQESEEAIRSNSAAEQQSNLRTDLLPQNDVAHEQQEIMASDEEREVIETLLKRMGKKFFVDYYEAYAAGEDLMKEIPAGVYTYNSVTTRVSTMRKIFREDLNVKALALIAHSQGSRLDEETVTYARELIELS